jgi:hypothetical protein
MDKQKFCTNDFIMFADGSQRHGETGIRRWRRKNAIYHYGIILLQKAATEVACREWIYTVLTTDGNKYEVHEPNLIFLARA